MPTLITKTDKIQKLAAQLQYSIGDWESQRREEDRLTVLSAARMMQKYLHEMVEVLQVPSRN
jgi:hypothetical protein